MVQEASLSSPKKSAAPISSPFLPAKARGGDAPTLSSQALLLLPASPSLFSSSSPLQRATTQLRPMREGSEAALQPEATVRNKPPPAAAAARNLQVPPLPLRRRKFKVSDEVDAYYNDGWWEGVVMEVSSDGKYSVFFRGTRDQLEFEESRIRIHREWANGKWTPSFGDEGEEKEDEEKLLSTEKKPNNKAAEFFSKGSLVEVSSDEEGFEGAWFVATIVKLLDNGNYLIEYQNLRNNDDTAFLQEETDRLHIRPRPPDIGSFESFKVLEEVDALHNDGWWVGVISKVLKGQRYKVYFKASNEELEFKHADIRLHLDWTNGKWVRASQALKL